MQSTAEILAIGYELTQGDVVNSNASHIARELVHLGYSVTTHVTVGDDLDRIAAAMKACAQRSDVLVVTGGLGPTCDDLTREGAARCAGVPLEFHPECARQIRQYYVQRLHAGPMPEENYSQAMLPQGSMVLDNDWGTAPGFAMTLGRCRIFALPGVPRECKAMLTHRVLPLLRREDSLTQVRTLRIFGLGESTVDALLRDRMLSLKNPTLAPFAKTGEVELRMTAHAQTPEQADALLDPLEQEVRGVLGDVIYGRDVSSLQQVVVALLKERGLTLGTAESCTGGMIASRITDVPGASQVLMGGIVAYQNRIKQQVLGVPGDLLDREGAVSPQVAQRMARGARQVLGCDLAISVTGLAGPQGDDHGHPGGTVFLSLTDGRDTWTRELHRGTDRDRVRHMATLTALDMVRRYLQGLSVIWDRVP